eukprot:m51a1_g489 putative replication factor c subunit 3-like (352) ;mRNA; r:229883-231472
MLWIDQYRPASLAALTFHPSLNTLLQRMAASKNMPHLLVYGPSGAGKKTRIACLLRAIYGPSAAKLRVESKLIKNPKEGGKDVEVTVVTSVHHIELNPADAGFQDRIVIQETIKEIAQTKPIDTAVPFKVIVIHEADQMGLEAQNALRRTMERYSRNCRLILCATSACRLIGAIRSRCFQLRVPLPTREELLASMQSVAREQSMALPDELAQRIADASEGNARKALLMLEAARARQSPLTVDQQIDRADWEEFVSTIATEIAQEQTPRRLVDARMKVYELLAHCIPPDVIIKKLTSELMRKTDSQLQHELVTWAAYYEHRIHQGTKPIYHIEAFIARFMSLYNKFLLESFA